MDIFKDLYKSSLNSFDEMFHKIDYKLWEAVNHNPMKFAECKGINHDFLKTLDSYESFENEVNELGLDKAIKADPTKQIIAYLSPEIAISQFLPSYAGGLGILAGDHLKSASDTNLPVVGITLNYRYGYFIQKLSKSGTQNAEYIEIRTDKNFIEKIYDESGNQKFIEIKLPQMTLRVNLFRIIVGNTFVILLDTDFVDNKDLRSITHNLYDSNREVRLLQEIVLGIGGIRALYELELQPMKLHINEGHASFALLEWIRVTKSNKNFEIKETIEFVRNNSIFTTHTPVIHGNEEFELNLIEKYFKFSEVTHSIGFKRFLNSGLLDNDKKMFSLTLMALNLCNNVNAVSKLHAITANRIWKDVLSHNNKKIHSITNGIHFKTWISIEFDRLFQRYLGQHYSNTNDNNYLDKLNAISDQELISAKYKAKSRLIEFLDNYLCLNPPDYIKRDRFENIRTILSEEMLMIGFARRFAPYKRADLIFNDIGRLSDILNNKITPVKLLISGKAHPADVDGKLLIKNIIKKIRDNSLEDKIIFIENYDLHIAKHLVRACDIWLNTPVRTLEASGTSGMKSALNGGINFSVLDGWWDEAYDSSNGWAIGNEYVNQLSDIEVSNLIYDTLESEIIPKYYSKNQHDSPWLKMMRHSINTILAKFSSHRMMDEYNLFYKK